MANIKRVLEAIGIITKEVRNMIDKDNAATDGLCVECDRPATHPRAYFCEDCAPDFYNGGDDE